jgi:acetylornithine deacetylase/succinyl-diaminopimelate desuccinylase-like protein
MMKLMGGSVTRFRPSAHFWIALGIVIVSAAAVVVAVSRTGRMPLDMTFVPRNTKTTPEIELLREYVRINTTNPPGNETAGARFLLAFLAKNGIRGELIEPAPNRGSVYARIRGKHRGGGLMLMSHIDVVAANSADWSQPPFAGKVSLDMMYGRGVLDMKGIAVCEIAAFADLARSGVVPENDVVFLATADEEAGGRWGTAWLLQHRPDVFSDVAFAITEGGITETVADKITYFGLEVGAKQAVNLKIRSSDRERLRQARIALEPLFFPEDPERVLPEVREFFRRIAAHRIENRPYLLNLDRAIAEGEFWRIHRALRSLTQNTLFCTGPKAEGAGWSMMAYLHNLPDEDPDRRIAAITELIAPYDVAVEVVHKDGIVPSSPWETPLSRAITVAVQREYGSIDVGPMLLDFSTTDARYLRPRGIVVYGTWPFAVNIYQTLGIHGIDERVRLDWFVRGVRMTKNLVRTFAAR